MVHGWRMFWALRGPWSLRRLILNPTELIARPGKDISGPGVTRSYDTAFFFFFLVVDDT